MSYADLEVQDLHDFLTEKKPIIIDMRDPGTRAKGELDNAKDASDSVISELIQSRRNDPTVLVYCYHGNSSRDLCNFLSRLGLSKIYNLVGGWQALEHHKSNGPRLGSEERQWLLEQGFEPDNLNSRIQLGMSPLMLAALKGETALVDTLLSAGADPKQVNDDEHHALWFACVSGDVSLVNKLIDAGSDINNRNVNGVTCSIYAASTGKLDILMALIDAGADLEICTHDGVSALESASTLPVLKFLRSHTKQAMAST